ncbi:hypothetical protein BH09MYX1_BH09MYX1_63830 [soil metagenome]
MVAPRIAVVLVLAGSCGVFACGQVADVPVDASVGDENVPDGRVDAAADANGKDAIPDREPDHRQPRDAMTACGQAPPWGDFECCEAGACRGKCITYGDEQICQCGLLSVGCPAGTFCCDGACKVEVECAR